MKAVRSGSAWADGRTTAPVWPHRVARGADRGLDGTVVVLASWTVVYHLALLAHLPSDVALAGEAAVLAVAVVVASRGPASGECAGGSSLDVRGAAATARGVTVLAALVAALAMALRLPWVLVWVLWLVAAGAGLVAACRGVARVDSVEHPVEHPVGRAETWFALTCTVGLALFAMFTLRANPDDLYYVNFSQWVAAHGSFPVRDTIFSDLVYPMSNWPPLASYDALTGALAHLFHLPAGDVVYVVVPPLLTALAVLACGGCCAPGGSSTSWWPSRSRSASCSSTAPHPTARRATCS